MQGSILLENICYHKDWHADSRMQKAPSSNMHNYKKPQVKHKYTFML